MNIGYILTLIAKGIFILTMLVISWNYDEMSAEMQQTMIGWGIALVVIADAAFALAIRFAPSGEVIQYSSSEYPKVGLIRDCRYVRLVRQKRSQPSMTKTVSVRTQSDG